MEPRTRVVYDDEVWAGSHLEERLKTVELLLERAESDGGKDCVAARPFLADRRRELVEEIAGLEVMERAESAATTLDSLIDGASPVRDADVALLTHVKDALSYLLKQWRCERDARRELDRHLHNGS